MKTLIIYNSLTGYTEKYALALKDRLGGEAQAVPLDKFKPKMLASFDKAVFMARVVNNTLAGFKTVVKHAALFAEKYTCVVAVGMSKANAAQYYNLEQSNIPYLLKGIPMFVLRGGFDASRLKGKDKFMVNMLRSRLEKSPSRTREEMALLKFLASVTDKFDADLLQPIVDYLESGVFNPPEVTDEAAVSWLDMSEYIPDEVVPSDSEEPEPESDVETDEQDND